MAGRARREGRALPGPTDELVAEACAQVVVEPANAADVDRLATALARCGAVQRRGDRLVVTMRTGGGVRDAAASVHRGAVAAGVDLVAFAAQRPSLEDRVLSVTGEETP